MSKPAYATSKTAFGAAFAVLGLALVLLPTAPTLAQERSQSEPVETIESVIVKAASVEHAEVLVREVGGRVTHKLGIIKAVAANVTPKQRAELEAMKGGVRIHGNHTATLDAKGGKGGGDKSLVVETY